MILPDMSEATSTLVCGRTWPLAVTDAVRSRASTASIFTSVAFVPFLLAVNARIPPINTTATPKLINFVFLLIEGSCRLAERASHRRFERGEGPVVIVNGVHTVHLGLREGAARGDHVEERNGAGAITLHGIRKLFTSLRRVGFLERHGSVCGHEVEIGLRDFGVQLQLARAETQHRVLSREIGRLHSLLAQESVEY